MRIHPYKKESNKNRRKKEILSHLIFPYSLIHIFFSFHFNNISEIISLINICNFFQIKMWFFWSKSYVMLSYHFITFLSLYNTTWDIWDLTTICSTQFQLVEEETRKKRKGEQDRDKRREKRDRKQWSGVGRYVRSQWAALRGERVGG